jgi:hypothetical protein
MRSNFDCPLNLKNGNKMVEACGPIVWAPGDPGLKVQVTINQPPNGGPAVANATSGKTFTDADGEWMFFLVGAGMTTGLADATAQFVNAGTGANVGAPWTQLVELK